MAHLDVNPLNLHATADSYTQLAAQVGALSPQAAAEVQRIVDTHGPMGFPVALGVATNLARKEAGLVAAAGDFTTYSHRFTEHAATYAQEDSAAAARYSAFDFQEGQNVLIDPSDSDDKNGEPLPPASTCWIGTSDGDTSVCSPDTTQHVYVEDGKWWLRQVDQSQYTVELPHNFGDRQELLPTAPANLGDPFAGLPSGTDFVMWPRSDGSIGAMYRNPDGTLMPEMTIPPGNLYNWPRGFQPI